MWKFAEMTKNSKSQISNNKQNTMTEIRNPKLLHHLKRREFQTCFGHWILEFVIYLRFGAWDLLFEKLVLRVLNFINPSIPKQLAIFTGKTI
jgi:hypothetical protein